MNLIMFYCFLMFVGDKWGLNMNNLEVIGPSWCVGELAKDADFWINI